MLNCIGIQWADMDAMSARQVMFIPASATAYARTLSMAHPRKPWTPISYAPLTNAFGDQDIQAKMRAQQWGDHGTSNAFLTCEPFGFTVSDDEWTETMNTAIVARNAPLRYMRSLDLMHGTVLGVGALAMGEVRANAMGALELAPGLTTADRLTHRLQQLFTAVENKDATLLDVITPASARARGDNVQRNQYNLPVNVPPVAAPETIAAPPLPVAALVAGAPVPPGTRLERPNGEVYITRKITADAGELSDVDMLRRAWARNINVMLFGVPGTGKTALVEVAAQQGLITMLGTNEITADDFLGTWVQVGPDSYEWVDGPLVTAIEEDKVLLIDEVGVIDTRAMTQVYGILDGRRSVTIPANPMRGEIEIKGTNFAIACATNPDAPGVRLSEALLSRMGLMVEVTTSYQVARTMGVNDKLIQAAEHFAALVKTDEIFWAPQMREMLDFTKIEAEFGVVFALRNLLNQCPPESREVVATNLKERFGTVTGISRKMKPLSVDD